MLCVLILWFVPPLPPCHPSASGLALTCRWPCLWNLQALLPVLRVSSILRTRTRRTYLHFFWEILAQIARRCLWLFCWGQFDVFMHRSGSRLEAFWRNHLWHLNCLQSLPIFVRYSIGLIGKPNARVYASLHHNLEPMKDCFWVSSKLWVPRWISMLRKTPCSVAAKKVSISKTWQLLLAVVFCLHFIVMSTTKIGLVITHVPTDPPYSVPYQPQ